MHGVVVGICGIKGSLEVTIRSDPIISMVVMERRPYPFWNGLAQCAVELPVEQRPRFELGPLIVNVFRIIVYSWFLC